MSTPRTSLRTKHTINSKSGSPFEVSMYEHVRMRRKNVMDTEERRRRLEGDPWALEVLPKLVKCRGCLRWIKLDQRSMYYGGLWNKHRDHCRCIKRMKGEQIPKEPEKSRRAAMSQRLFDRQGFLEKARKGETQVFLEFRKHFIPVILVSMSGG
ncbi:hypothetical protein C0993_012156 [Termitomyces sp. T159_Od127]|nr:hypothetical protein C0993_012156 [Termitomyces sp. T159_Od127]